MPNLRDRLKYIHELRQNEKEEKKEIPNNASISIPGWESCDFQVLKRNINVKLSLKSNNRLPQAIKVLIPDLAGQPLPELRDFKFFDLETTGLSTGAGTVAFLAAFGSFCEDGTLGITQYLLLDYPGEASFLNAVLEEFHEKIIIVSYNGKCYDSPLLKARFLMNGIRPPEYHHVDLLHPSRRLWKNIIGDCSQSSIETKILCLDRTGDIPGSEAPEIWFEFLKTGKIERLLGICDHNAADIKGLSSILAAMIAIAGDPLGQKKFNFDITRLAFFWRSYCCRNKRYLLPENKDLLNVLEKLLLKIIGFVYDKETKNEAKRYLSIYNKRWKKLIGRSGP